MRMFCFSFAALLATTVAYADETYTIKLKFEPDIGKVVTVKNVEKAQGSIKVLDPDGTPKTDEKPEGKDEEFRDVVLERNKDGKDTKFLRTYVKARKGKGDKERTLSYEGATLLFEKQPTGWQLSVAGTAKLTPKDADDLVKKLNEKDQDDLKISENLAPKKPVKIGEEWTLDNKATLGHMKLMQANLEKSALKAKLTKVFMQGKSQMGVLDVDFKIVIDKAFGAVVLDPPGVIHMKGTLTAAIDGSTTEATRTTKNTFDADGKFGPAGQQGRMTFKIESEESFVTSPEKDDAQARVIPKTTPIAGAGVWMEFTSKEHGFKAMFPGQPQTQSRKDKNGNVTTQYAVSVGDNLGYIVAITDFPKELPLDAETVLTALEANTNIKEKSKIKMNGYAGREFVLDVGTKDKPMKGIQRVYIVGSRMYQALYIEGADAKGDAKKFLDSFRFDAKQKGKDD